MTCTNFPSSGLVANVTTHQVGEILYKWTGSVWEAVSPPVDFINNLSLPYVFDDESDLALSSTSFPLRKSLKVQSADAFTNYIVSNSGDADIGDVLMTSGLWANKITKNNSRWDQAGFNGASVNVDTPNLIGGHSLNYIAPDVHSSVVGGGGATNRENVIGGDTSKVDLNESNVFVDPANSLGFGSRYAFIGGGYDNVCNGLANAILVGYHCYIENSDHSTLVGGSYHKILEGQYNVVGGGTNNKITTSAAGTISGGRDNTITKTGNDSAVTIGGGRLNTATDSGATIAGGVSNTADGLNATVSGGTNNNNTQNNSVIAGGNGNTLTGSQGAVISGGIQNTVSGESAVITGGRGNTASESYSQAEGFNAKVRKAGATGRAVDMWRVAGDRQANSNIMSVTTTGGTESIVRFFDNTTDFIADDHAVFFYEVVVLGHRTDIATAENATFKLQGMLHRDTGVWVQSKSPDINLGGTTWNADLRDNGFGNLRLYVTGEAAKTIEWSAFINTWSTYGRP